MDVTKTTNKYIKKLEKITGKLPEHELKEIRSGLVNCIRDTYNKAIDDCLLEIHKNNDLISTGNFDDVYMPSDPILKLKK